MKYKDLLGTSLSMIIIILVFFSFISIAYAMVDYVIESRPFPELPDVKYHEIGERNIVLRIDDIQAFVLGDVQKKIINDTLERGYTASLAVIPYNLEEDRILSRFLIHRRGDIEIALHGLDNEFDEFKYLSYKESLNKIEEGLDSLSFIEPEVRTFIPPNNEYSDEILEVLREKNLGLSGGYWNSKYGLSATTYDWEEERFVLHDELLNDCKSALDESGLCVVMIHPQDFLTNGKLDLEKYENYLIFLDNIKNLDSNVVNFRDLWVHEV